MSLVEKFFQFAKLALKVNQETFPSVISDYSFFFLLDFHIYLTLSHSVYLPFPLLYRRSSWILILVSNLYLFRILSYFNLFPIFSYTFICYFSLWFSVPFSWNVMFFHWEQSSLQSWPIFLNNLSSKMYHFTESSSAFINRDKLNYTFNNKQVPIWGAS